MLHDFSKFHTANMYNLQLILAIFLCHLPLVPYYLPDALAPDRNDCVLPIYANH